MRLPIYIGGGSAHPFPGSPPCDILAGGGTEQIYTDAVRILRDCGPNAAVADTGGGTVCITVSEAGAALDEPRFTFGAAGETWAAEVSGDPSGLWTDVRPRALRHNQA